MTCIQWSTYEYTSERLNERCQISHAAEISSTPRDKIFYAVSLLLFSLRLFVDNYKTENYRFRRYANEPELMISVNIVPPSNRVSQFITPGGKISSIL